MQVQLTDKKLLKNTEKIIKKYQLCDHCIGRIYAKVGTGQLNEERGKILRENIDKTKKIAAKDCWLCNGTVDEVSHFVKLVENALKNYEYDTFVIGSKIDEDIIEREKEIINFSKSEYSESIKNELNREVGKVLEKKLKKEVNFEKPTIMVILDTSYDVVNLQIASLYIYGRYKKYSRSIPQTKWFCKICHGKGCRKCNYTGKIYDTSVEELVAKDILKAAKGQDESFHGCGREDVDARMLGNGRPFVLEIKNPVKRKIDLCTIGTKINNKYKDLIQVNNLRFSDTDEVVRIKNASFRKIYRVKFKCNVKINNEKLKKVASSLRELRIGQLTPSRVAHRRADMVREKYIYNCTVESVDGTMAVLTLEAESGTYIKELVSGDNGRTKPSITEMIQAPCTVTELDVIEIKGE